MAPKTVAVWPLSQCQRASHSTGVWYANLQKTTYKANQPTVFKGFQYMDTDLPPEILIIGLPVLVIAISCTLLRLWRDTDLGPAAAREAPDLHNCLCKATVWLPRADMVG